MDRDLKVMIGKAVGGFVLFSLVIYFFLNGFGGFPYDKAELEQVFIAEVKERELLKDEPYHLVFEEYANSITYAIETEGGERACATYVGNLFFSGYKEGYFYAGKTGVLSLDEFQYTVNDRAMIYDMKVQFKDVPMILPGETVKPIMYYKFFGICIVAMGFFGGRMFFGRKKN